MKTIRRIVCSLLICAIILGFGFTASGIESENSDLEDAMLFEFDLTEFIEDIELQPNENSIEMTPVRRTYTRDVRLASGDITARLTLDVTHLNTGEITTIHSTSFSNWSWTSTYMGVSGPRATVASGMGTKTVTFNLSVDARLSSGQQQWVARTGTLAFRI